MMIRTFCVALLILLSSIISCQASVDEYLVKYSNAQVSEKQVERLRKYDYLIQFFCSICWFKPNHRVSPAFMRALILAESDGIPDAISNKGAVGLTQITPETGREAVRQIETVVGSLQFVDQEKLKELTAEALKDPAINLLLASYLISKYNNYYSGQLDLVVAAWNAGEYSLVKESGVPAYGETENLIGKVNGYYWYFLMQKEKG